MCVLVMKSLLLSVLCVNGVAHTKLLPDTVAHAVSVSVQMESRIKSSVISILCVYLNVPVLQKELGMLHSMLCVCACDEIINSICLVC